MQPLHFVAFAHEMRCRLRMKLIDCLCHASRTMTSKLGSGSRRRVGPAEKRAYGSMASTGLSGGRTSSGRKWRRGREDDAGARQKEEDKSSTVSSVKLDVSPRD